MYSLRVPILALSPFSYGLSGVSAQVSSSSCLPFMWSRFGQETSSSELFASSLAKRPRNESGLPSLTNNQAPISDGEPHGPRAVPLWALLLGRSATHDSCLCHAVRCPRHLRRRPARAACATTRAGGRTFSALPTSRKSIRLIGISRMRSVGSATLGRSLEHCNVKRRRPLGRLLLRAPPPPLRVPFPLKLDTHYEDPGDKAPNDYRKRQCELMKIHAR